MAIYEGIISGIGDKESGVNVITPEFDARIRHFIVGKDCIIDGLELEKGILRAGACLARGYVGTLENDVDFTDATRIYAVFEINKSDKPDKFWLTNDLPKWDNADILHEAGSYWLLLYENGNLKVDRDYPQNAVYSESTQYVVDMGAIGLDVTTESDYDVNDESVYSATKRGTFVANTKYVHDVIEKEIVTKKYTGTYNVTSSAGVINQIVEYSIYKKATFVIIKFKIIFKSLTVGADRVILKVPSDCIPKYSQKLYVQSLGGGTDLLSINTNGELVANGLGAALSDDYSIYQIGYSITEDLS